jgi:hypothetical protein
MICRVVLTVTVCASVARADEVRDHMRLFDDGKHHVLAYAPGDNADSATLAYGTTAELTILRLVRQTMTQPGDFWHFDDPRYYGRTTVLALVDGTLTVTCAARQTTFRPSNAKLPAKTLLKPLAWRVPVYLARDDSAVYYYVDRGQPLDNVKSDPRLYIGKRGAMRVQTLTGQASDSSGMLLVTSHGSFKYKRGPDTFEWIGTDRKSVPLDGVRVDNDLIYNELGVYAGQRMGTPCDDL